MIAQYTIAYGRLIPTSEDLWYLQKNPKGELCCKPLVLPYTSRDSDVEMQRGHRMHIGSSDSDRIVGTSLKPRSNPGHIANERCINQTSVRFMLLPIRVPHGGEHHCGQSNGNYILENRIGTARTPLRANWSEGWAATHFGLISAL